MARIIIVDNPLNPSDYQIREWVGPYCSNDGQSGFLNKFYPEGFPGSHQTFLNKAPLPVEDYGLVLAPGDEVVLLVAPGAPVAAAVGAVVSAVAASPVLAALAVAVVSTAVSYALAPSAPKLDVASSPSQVSLPKAESVYNLAVPQNQVRLGDSIPVAYGKNRIVPDYATQAWSKYHENNQWVFLLFCLGQGEYGISDIYISNTSVNRLAPGSVSYKSYSPTDHTQTIGFIDSDFVDTIGGFPENVITSIEVSDIELETPTELSSSGTILAADAIDVTTADIPPIGTTIYIFGVPHTIETVNGSQITISPATLDQPFLLFSALRGDARIVNGDLEINVLNFDNFKKLVDNTQTGDALTVSFGGASDYVISGEIGAIAINYVLTLTNITQTGANTFSSPDWVIYTDIDIEKAASSVGDPVSFIYYDVSTLQQFIVGGPGQEIGTIEIDYVFPGGLYKVNKESGELESNSVDFLLEATQIDQDGNPTGAPTISTTWNETLATTTPQRRTNGLIVPSGDYYLVRFARTSAASENDSRVVDRVLWTGLKGFVYSQYGKKGYGDVTLLAMKVKATNGISSNALNRISVSCTRKLNGADTTSAQDAFIDIWSNVKYGANQNSSLIEGTLSGSFNAVFDFQSNVWEALQTVANAADYRIFPRGSELVLIDDNPNLVPVMSFVEGQTSGGLIEENSLSVTYALGNRTDEDGVEIEYRDEITYEPAYALYPSTSVRPRSVKLIGCTCNDTAVARARKIWNKSQFSRFTWKFNSELDALILNPGDVINIVPLNKSPVLCVVSEVRHTGGTKTSVIAFEYDERAYA